MAISMPNRTVQSTPPTNKPLGLLLIDPFLAVSAMGGGLALLVGLIDLPNNWLDKLPFDSFAIPAIVLTVVVGGAWLAATIALFANRRFAPVASIAAGVVQLGWFAAQIAFLGYISWMQPFVGTLALVVIVLAGQWQKSLAIKDK